jgi:hypothetical protein
MDGTVLRFDDAVDLEEGAVADVCERALGEDGGVVRGERRRDFVADEEDAAVNDVQPFACDAVVDAAIAQAGGSKLPACDGTLLRSSDRRDGGIHVENLNNVLIPEGLLRFATTVVDNLNRVRRG